MKIILTESQFNSLLESSKIKCQKCGWSWKKSEGGDDLYVCHKCGHNNEPKSPSKEIKKTNHSE